MSEAQEYVSIKHSTSLFYRLCEEHIENLREIAHLFSTGTVEVSREGPVTGPAECDVCETLVGES